MAAAGVVTGTLSEPEFAALVDTLAADPAQRAQLIDLLSENHPFYDERASATVVRMRGWVLLAIARGEVADNALIFILEELDTGVDPYLVAAAARALRSYPRPSEALAPFVMRALGNIRYRDELVSFERYGEYATSPTGTTAVSELLATLGWLGPHARAVLPELDALRSERALSRRLRLDLDRALLAIRGSTEVKAAASCCGGPLEGGNISFHTPETRRNSTPVEPVVLQDHDGARVTFGQFFHGHPSIVVFFYTRCDNPLKCSLTIAKLARVQKLLEAQGLGDRIHTAAITYDPAYDLPKRLRVYGQDRDVRMDANHRMLRTVDDSDALRSHFELGVNFIESLVNRHRIEVYILDTQGRVAVSFERIQWDEQDVVARAVEVLNERAPAGQSGAILSALSES